MIKQTITLFRYQLLGIINLRIMLSIVVILLTAFLISRFIAELAIINSEAIALAAMADILRYSLILLLVFSLCFQVSQDFELHQFERLLAMPVSRSQYVIAQFLVLVSLAFAFSVPVFFLFVLLNHISLAFYWSIAVFLEMLLVGQFAILAIMSLEKLPVAIFFTLAIYLLAKAAPIIELALSQSSDFYNDETGFQLTAIIFPIIQFVLPDLTAFAQNNFLLEPAQFGLGLVKQLVSVLVYGLFLQFVILLDFYRKEFNRS